MPFHFEDVVGADDTHAQWALFEPHGGNEPSLLDLLRPAPRQHRQRPAVHLHQRHVVIVPVRYYLRGQFFTVMRLTGELPDELAAQNELLIELERLIAEAAETINQMESVRRQLLDLEASWRQLDRDGAAELSAEALEAGSTRTVSACVATTSPSRRSSTV